MKPKIWLSLYHLPTLQIKQLYKLTASAILKKKKSKGKALTCLG